MASSDEQRPPAPPSLPSSSDKLISFGVTSITKNVPVKLNLEKINYNSWSSFFKIHLGSIRFNHNSITSSMDKDWSCVDDLFKVWVLGTCSKSIQDQVVTTLGTALPVFDALHYTDVYDFSFHSRTPARPIVPPARLVRFGRPRPTRGHVGPRTGQGSSRLAMPFEMVTVGLENAYGLDSFGKHLEEIHVTWAQFGKKHDMNATLQNFDEALVYRSWRRLSKAVKLASLQDKNDPRWDRDLDSLGRKDFHLRSSVFQGDNVTRFCDGVKVADMKKP
ncbi:hypothetical protein Tco_0226236 [Tanacetum coccineum]